MQVKTTPENIAKIEYFVSDIQNLFVNLYSRWQDEKEHEDIEDYATAFKKTLPLGFVLTKMTKRPFGFKFTIGTEAEYCVYLASGSYGWKRTK